MSDTATRTITLADFLEPYEIAACQVAWKHVEHCPTCHAIPGAFVKLIEEQLITPRIERINKRLGQENDPKYLALVVEAVMATETRQSQPGGAQARAN